VLLNHPRWPEPIDFVRIADLTAGAGSVDLMLRRRGGDVAVNILSRKGNAEVVVHL
jgi:tRNA1(Val) A37 N6-methylase TrmN6